MSGQEILTFLGIKLGLLFPGLMAGLMSAKIEGKKGVWNYTFSAFVGALTTTYMTPVVSIYFNFDNQYSFGLAFFIGLISMNLATVIIKISGDLDFVKGLIKK